MSQPRDEATRPDADDAALVERLREGYRPEPLTPTRRAAFDTALRQRLERPARRVWAATAAATAAALVWFALSGATPRRTQAVLPAAAVAAWQAEVLFPEELGATATSDDERMLPPDYLALASAFDL
jgi:hypothetical protein